jgi:GNAT superfamily N-acetyltransferase
MLPIETRSARSNDVERIVELMMQLGYAVPAAALRDRLQRLDERRAILVATSGDDVVGWAAVCIDEPFVEGFGAHLEGLVVDESRRSEGIGARLLDAAEAWARARGCAEMRVQSNVIRERAHVFYERHSYTTIKAQYQLRKRL